jgi:hypothetical protein
MGATLSKNHLNKKGCIPTRQVSAAVNCSRRSRKGPIDKSVIGKPVDFIVRSLKYP